MGEWINKMKLNKDFSKGDAVILFGGGYPCRCTVVEAKTPYWNNPYVCVEFEDGVTHEIRRHFIIHENERELFESEYGILPIEHVWR